MERLTLSGRLAPTDSFALAARLDELTSVLRPAVTVDLTEVDVMHPSIVSVLIRFRRQARRQGGNLVVVPPTTPSAHRTLDQTGLDTIVRLGVPA